MTALWRQRYRHALRQRWRRHASYGNRRADRIFGGNGNDTAVGGGENDLIFGGAGDDTVEGNTQNDTLWRGPGWALRSGSTAPTASRVTLVP